MKDTRRIIVIFVIAVLFAILVNVTIEAVYPHPEYSDFCGDDHPRIMKPNGGEICPAIDTNTNSLDDCKGHIAYKYDKNGCPTETYCETCQLKFDDINERYNMIVFIISAILGLLALGIGLYLPQNVNPVNEWVGSGLLLGGIFVIATGTARYFGDMGRFLRPVVIFAELALVIYLSYKKLGPKPKQKNPKKKSNSKKKK